MSRLSKSICRLTRIGPNASIACPWRIEMAWFRAHGHAPTMGFFRKAALNIGVVAELLTFFGSNKRWWLLPMLIILFLFVALIIVAQSSAIAPFVYTLF